MLRVKGAEYPFSFGISLVIGCVGAIYSLKFWGGRISVLVAGRLFHERRKLVGALESSMGHRERYFFPRWLEPCYLRGRWRRNAVAFNQGGVLVRCRYMLHFRQH